MQSIEAELAAPVATLFLRALELEAARAGFALQFHFREPGGSHVREHSRKDEILTIRSAEVSGHGTRVLVESETLDIGPLVERSARRAAADLIAALLPALAPALGEDTRARLQREIDTLLGN
ncbi:MAG: hypothetical protein HYU88_01085 [Chloroflexi bacterium]|nr:hypothetical protein [Chloroflexota bacterium]MBI4504370.1 hypothetical protein [Chloroflexota bacterium]